MFEFFRDAINEVNGIDVKAAKHLKNEEYEREKLNRFIFSKKSKAIIFIIGISYFLYAGMMIAMLINTGINPLYIIKYIILSMLDIIVCLCLLIGSKKFEIVALIGVIIFLFLLYFANFLN